MRLADCWFAARATDPGGDSVAVRFAWGDGDTSNWSGLVASGDSVTVEHTYTKPETCLVSAQARDRSNLASEWATPRAVVIGIQSASAPSIGSGPTGPARAMVLDACTFSCRVTDPDSGSVMVRFDWGDGDTSGWSSWVSSPASLSMTHQYGRAQDYRVRVEARNWAGQECAWNAGAAITIQTTTEVGKPKWAFHMKYCLNSSPAVGEDGTIYVSWEALYALNPDGSPKWQGPEINRYASDPVIAPDGTIYWTEEAGPMRAARPDGSLKWSRSADGDCFYVTGALAQDGTIYASSGGGTMFAVNPDSTTRWRCTFGHYGTGPAAVGPDGTVYAVGGENGELYALSSDGTLKWTFPTGDQAGTQPAIDCDGTIYFTSCDSCLHAVRPDSTEKWHFKTRAQLFEPAAIGPDRTIYVGSSDHRLYAIDSLGNEKWNYDAGAPISSSPAIASDGTIYFATTVGLYAIDSEGNRKWVWPTGWMTSQPTIGPDGTVYLVACPWLYAINGTAPLANSPWPMSGHDPQHTGRAGGGK